MRPVVDGVLETALYVSDLDRSAGFYEEMFGFPVIHSENDRMRALSVAGRQVLLLFRVGGSTEGAESPSGKIPPHDGQGRLHLAFAVAENQLQSWREWLHDKDIAIESEVDCGGRSLYFRDPDGHLLELISPGCWPIY
ncbi:MAG TPA: VOC family protein [Bryobacteraceae bacterium]|jgi:catechol 2,3-dioxygenase-like lactoylglutathione lyase family enzyme|nr:VOC family protein [Bryobacteraceae bacterium]